jgi:hypothetical protein
MTTFDLDFARRTVTYLRSQRLRSHEIERVLTAELGCPARVASRLVATR